PLPAAPSASSEPKAPPPHSHAEEPTVAGPPPGRAAPPPRREPPRDDVAVARSSARPSTRQPIAPVPRRLPPRPASQRVSWALALPLVGGALVLGFILWLSRIGGAAPTPPTNIPAPTSGATVVQTLMPTLPATPTPTALPTVE